MQVPARLLAHVVNIYYLHGFASGATSTKARWLGEKLAPHGVELLCPDFNLPDFSTLTVTRMIADVERWMAADRGGPVALFGSSLGALVAYHTAVANPRVERLILLAPALDIAPSLRQGLGDTKVDAWQRDGSLEVFHYGYNEPRSVNYTLFEDCERYDPFATPLGIPILIFQGRKDTSVNPAMVERFAATRPNVELHMLDDDHQLISSLPYIWKRTASFLGLA